MQRSHFVCVGCVEKYDGDVGAVPVCPPASPHKGASVVHSPRTIRVFFVMETPLRGRSGGHIGAAPTVSFGQIACGTVMSFGWITRKWIIEFGRSGYRCTHLFYPVKGTFHYFFKNRLARWMASLNWRGLMWKLGMGLRWLSVTSMVPSGCFVMMVSPPMMKP